MYKMYFMWLKKGHLPFIMWQIMELQYTCVWSGKCSTSCDLFDNNTHISVDKIVDYYWDEIPVLGWKGCGVIIWVIVQSVKCFSFKILKKKSDLQLIKIVEIYLYMGERVKVVGSFFGLVFNRLNIFLSKF